MPVPCAWLRVEWPVLFWGPGIYYHIRIVNHADEHSLGIKEVWETRYRAFKLKKTLDITITISLVKNMSEIDEQVTKIFTWASETEVA